MITNVADTTSKFCNRKQTKNVLQRCPTRISDADYAYIICMKSRPEIRFSSTESMIPIINTIIDMNNFV